MNPSKEQIISDLKKILVDDLFVEVPPEEMKPTDVLSTDLGLDSVGHFELSAIVQDRYGIAPGNEDDAWPHYRTLETLSDYIWTQLQNRPERASA